MSLTWWSASHSAQAVLQQFVCADPPKKQYSRQRGQWHPRPWDLEVQSWIRALRPPLPKDQALLLGTDDVGVAAVVHFGFDDEGEQLIVFAVARALRCRGRGHGAEALGEALKACRATKQRHGLDCGVFARVHPRNGPSMELFKSAGFVHAGLHEGHESWVHDLS